MNAKHKKKLGMALCQNLQQLFSIIFPKKYTKTIADLPLWSIYY